MNKYCSYEFRTKKEVRGALTSREKELMLVLMAFGATIDPHGYDEGDYDSAMAMLLGLGSNSTWEHVVEAGKLMNEAPVSSDGRMAYLPKDKGDE